MYLCGRMGSFLCCICAVIPNLIVERSVIVDLLGNKNILHIPTIVWLTFLCKAQVSSHGPVMITLDISVPIVANSQFFLTMT